MPARTGDTYTTPTGVVNTKKKTYAGKGPAPTGTKKVRPKTIDEVPVVTVTSSGVSAQNFAKSSAANRAVRKQERAQRRVRRVVSTQRKQEEVKARKAIPTVDRFVSSIADHAADAAEAISSAPKLVTRARNEAAVKAVEFPKQKTTEAFGKPTLGTPRVKQVVRAKKQGTLQVNKAGKVTIPVTRKAARELRRATKVYDRKKKQLQPGDGSVESRIGSQLQRRGLDRVQAAGVLGNAYAESNYDPSAMEPGTDNGGLWGFTAGEVARSEVEKFANARGKPWDDAIAQTNFLLEHVDPGTLQRMKESGSPERSAEIFMEEFERPGIPRTEVRTSAARQAFDSGKWGKPKPVPKQVTRRLEDAERKAQRLGISSKRPSKTASKPEDHKLWAGKKRGHLRFSQVMENEPLYKDVSPEMLRLGRAIVGISGEDPEIISGYRPGSTTESGTPDRHSKHNALDFAADATSADGKAKGDRIASAAAKAAGLDPKDPAFQEFLKVGGEFTVKSPSGYDVEIIWNTPQWGGHLDHVHVGIEPEAGAETAGSAPQGPVPVPKGQRQYFEKTGGNEHLRFVPILTKQLVKLAKASGEPIQVNSGFRTRAEQTELWNAYQAGEGNLAAEPGTSNHEGGLAVDLQLSDKQRSLLSKFGLGLPVSGEDWHVELVDPALVAKAEGQSAISVPGVASSFSGSGSYSPSSGFSAGYTFTASSGPNKGKKQTKPITRAQQIKRNERKIESIQGKPTEQKSETNSGLADLERRYGKAVV